jgi:hypothetical protein
MPEPAEQQDRRQHANCGELSSDRSVRAGHEKDTGEAIDERRALVVEERREIEGKPRAVLVPAVVGDRVRVVRDRRLVAEEARRIVVGDPELEGADRGDDGQPAQDGGPSGQPRSS